jgi:hypothetical protein
VADPLDPARDLPVGEALRLQAVVLTDRQPRQRGGNTGVGERPQARAGINSTGRGHLLLQAAERRADREGGQPHHRQRQQQRAAPLALPRHHARRPPPPLSATHNSSRTVGSD